MQRRISKKHDRQAPHRRGHSGPVRKGSTMQEPEMLRILRSSEDGRELLKRSYYVDTGEPLGSEIPASPFTEEEEAKIVDDIYRTARETREAWLKPLSPKHQEKLAAMAIEAEQLWQRIEQRAAEIRGSNGHHQANGNGQAPPKARPNPPPDTQ